jgi:allophanate hydrolase
MDRDAFEIAHAALGYNGGGAAIEVSLGGIALECVEGSVTVAIAGGGFVITLDKTAMGSWSVVNVRAGSSMTIRPGPWGRWTYVAFAGRLVANAWLGSYSTHASSGFGGGRNEGSIAEIEDAELREERAREIFCPAWAAAIASRCRVWPAGSVLL